MIWKPHATVAAVLEQDGKFLLVEEHTPQGLLFNQPAGHWEPNETLLGRCQCAKSWKNRPMNSSRNT